MFIVIQHLPKQTMACDVENPAFVGDIEDLLHHDSDSVVQERTTKTIPKHSSVSLNLSSDSHKKCLRDRSEPTGSLRLKCHGCQKEESFLPGTKTVYVKTWGCSHNTSDSEYMAGLLNSSGYQISKDPNYADIWVLNSCTVKTPSEQHLLNLISSASNRDVPVVVAGCVPQAAPQTTWLKGLSVVGVQQIDRIVEVVEQTLKGNCVRLFSTKKSGKKRLGGASLALPKIRKNPLIEILAINTGCLNHCTYCKTKQARGDLASYPIEQLVERATQAFQEGVKEIWLTSEDLGAYGRDLGVTLPELLFRLVETIPSGAMMRLGMTNPPYILDHLEEISEILNHPRVYAFLHIPIQSGSDAVLTDMRREYTAKHFCTIMDHVVKTVPDVSVATDVICGFPTETEEDFEETMEVVRRYRFPSLFINQFYPRPNTPAARMKRIDTAQVKKRTKSLSDLFASYRPYDHLVGTEQTVLITEMASDNVHMVGHAKAYQQVLVPYNGDYMGQMLRVKITGAGKHYLTGKVVWGSWLRRNVSAKISSVKKAIRLDLESVLVVGTCVISFCLLKFAANKWK